jgi:hypothetical protein
VSDIITAGDISTGQWIDAYTAHLEGVAEAVSSSELRREMVKAIDHAQADVRKADTEENNIILDQQKNALFRSGLGKFDREAFNLIRQLWKKCAEGIKSTGLCLSEQIDVEQKPSGDVTFSQGKSKITCPLQMAEVMMAFLKFCAKRSEESRESPLEYTKRLLADQGITKDNWFAHAANTAIADPWADERLPGEAVSKILLP